jgi:hypothetical protein
MDKYIFPKNTCEKINDIGFAQPYSALFNIINCIMVLTYLLETKKQHNFLLLLSLFCFELFHTISHIVHIDGSIQINVTHSLSYIMNIAFFYFFYKHTNIFPDDKFLLFIFVLVCLDTYALMKLSIVYYLMTQFLIFISLLMYYYKYLPDNVQMSTYSITFLAIVIVLLFLNETKNCEKMMKMNENFPYHIFIETIGILFFYILCKNYYYL